MKENQDFQFAWLRFQELGYSKNIENFLFSGPDPLIPEEVIQIQVDRNIYFQVFEIQEIIKFLAIFEILI